MGHADVGEERGTKARHVDDLFGVVGGGTGLRRESTQSSSRGVELHPGGGFALREKFEAGMGFPAGGLEAEIAGEG